MDDPFYPNLIIHTNVKKIVIYICICWPANFLKDHKKAPEHGVIFMFLSK